MAIRDFGVLPLQGVAGLRVNELTRLPIDERKVGPLVVRVARRAARFLVPVKAPAGLYPGRQLRVAVQALRVDRFYLGRMALRTIVQNRVLAVGLHELA